MTSVQKISGRLSPVLGGGDPCEFFLPFRPDVLQHTSSIIHCISAKLNISLISMENLAEVTIVLKALSVAPSKHLGF